MWWLWWGCARPPVVEAAVDEPAPLSVAFAPDGRVIVDGRALLDPATGRAVGILGYAFSPSAARHAWEDLGLHWTETGGPSHLLDVERWVGGDLGPPRQVAAWIDEDRLYVHQIDVASVYRAQVEPVVAEACRVIDVRTGAIATPKECVAGDFVELWRVQMRDGLVIVDSAGEGHPGLTVYGWDPEAGARDVGFPALDLYPFGPVEASPRADGGVDLLTPCHLGESERPCQRPDGEDRADEPWRHYRWTRAGLELVRDGLPARIAADPTGDGYAWAAGGEVCLGSPGEADPRCFDAPRVDGRPADPGS